MSQSSSTLDIPCFVIFFSTHIQHLQYCHPLTGAAPTALPFVYGRVEALVVSCQLEVYTFGHGKEIRVTNIKKHSVKIGSRCFMACYYKCNLWFLPQRISTILFTAASKRIWIGWLNPHRYVAFSMNGAPLQMHWSYFCTMNSKGNERVWKHVFFHL